MGKTDSKTQRGIREGYLSGLEKKVAKELGLAGVLFGYESLQIKYTQPAKLRTYTPDFILPNGIIVETKGRFLTSDRQKHLLVQEQYPELDIRFVFSNSTTKLYKGSATSYAAWCTKHGFVYADKSIPEEWLMENPRSYTPVLRRTKVYVSES